VFDGGVFDPEFAGAFIAGLGQAKDGAGGAATLATATLAGAAVVVGRLRVAANGGGGTPADAGGAAGAVAATGADTGAGLDAGLGVGLGEGAAEAVAEASAAACCMAGGGADALSPDVWGADCGVSLGVALAVWAATWTVGAGAWLAAIGRNDGS
jgi:hypothetical protein